MLKLPTKVGSFLLENFIYQFSGCFLFILLCWIMLIKELHFHIKLLRKCLA